MSVAKKLAGQTAAYGLSTILGRVLNYLLVPIYTAVFAPEEYGIVTYLYAFAAFFNILYTYGMETAFFRFANKPGADKQLLYNRVQTLLLTSSALFSGLLILFSGQLAQLMNRPAAGKYIVWLALVVALDAIVAIPFARLRLENKAIRFASIKLANILVNIGGNILILVVLRNIYEGNYLSSLQPLAQKLYNPTVGIGYVFLVNLLANLLYVPLLWREFMRYRPQFSWEALRPMLIYAYPLMLMGFAGMVNEVLDRILLEEWLPDNFYPGMSNMAAVGIYGACYKLSIFMSLAIQAFRYAAEPFFFSQAKEKNSPETFALVMKWFVLSCIFIFLFISANLEDFALILRSPSYRSGIMVVPVLLLANLFLGVYYNLSVWFKLTDKTYFGSMISIGGAVITILFNLLLIPVWGYMGAAVTTLLCYFSMALTCYLLGARHFPVPYPVLPLAGYLLLALVLAALALFVPVEDFWLRHLWHLSLCLVFPLSVWRIEKPVFRLPRR